MKTNFTLLSLTADMTHCLKGMFHSLQMKGAARKTVSSNDACYG